MTIAEKLAQIKKLVFDTAMPPAAPATPPAPVAPVAAAAPAAPAQPPAPAAPAAPATMDYTLLDGSKITCTSLAVGGDVLVNGSPAPAGTYVFSDNSSIVVDDKGKITQLIPAPVTGPEDTIEDMSTPQAMAAAVQKFAVGTPEQQLANIWVVLKAVFQSCFGWQLRQAQEQLDTANAIAAYQQSMGTLTPQVAGATSDITAMKAQFASQVETIKLMYEAISELAGKPTAVTPEPAKQLFAHIAPTTKEEKTNKMLAGMQAFLEANKQKTA